MRAAERKGFLDWLKKSPYDIVCVQETKVSDPCVLNAEMLNPDGFSSYWACSTEKKGYSGVAMYTKEKPLKVEILKLISAKIFFPKRDACFYLILKNSLF